MDAFLSSLAKQAPKSARPAVLGDVLSFDTHPVIPEDLLECYVDWEQDFNSRSDKYIAFKAQNVTAGDLKPMVRVFVQSDFYAQRFGDKSGIATFPVTPEWQYGQLNKTGAGRFLVLHDKANTPFQSRFVATLFTQLGSVLHDALCARGYVPIADSLEDIEDEYFGEYLYSFNTVVTQGGDALIIPSAPIQYWFQNPKTITWTHPFSTEHEEYYGFMVPNETQKGQDVMFFIQKEWWDTDNISENHISKIAKKNANGDYRVVIGPKFQYGQADKTGKNRWVVYHDEDRKPPQHCFVKSISETPIDGVVGAIFGPQAESALEDTARSLEDLLGYDGLDTFT
ncbi:hypothetical protein RhiJN_22549 [Ceratobasidium sp. AG-Ba]|nr:hypothetical protein RhiJN_22549 [Ceratobasidium sp. AG-Ba]